MLKNCYMDSYVSFKKIPSMWGLNKGDVVLISSDVTRLFTICHENNEEFDINVFIDEIKKVVGETGTILFPTYNWDYCHNVPFNYKKTRSQTGLMGQIAMKRSDFKRTKHPIYSFAVYGKDQEMLCKMNNITSFGPDSPFAYLEDVKACNIIIDVPYNHCFTFMHYIEQKTQVSYRYEKTFSVDYVDEKGKKEVRSYSMYVRNLDMDVVNDMTKMGELFEAKGISCKQFINDIEFKKVDLALCAPLIEDDIRFNRSKKICRYKGQ